MPTYLNADLDVADLVNRVKAQYHPELVDAEVTIEILMAEPSRNKDGEPKGPALKLHGYPAQATIKRTSTKDRVAGMADAILTIDAENWRALPDAERVPLIDHELTHLELCHGKEGELLADDHGRPKLKIRLHDLQAGWFREVAHRHGDTSAEIKQARQLMDEQGQYFFGWVEATDLPSKRRRVAS